MYPLQEHFSGISVKKRVLVKQNRACSKSETIVNIVLSKKYGSISGFKEEEQRNRRETEPKHKKLEVKQKIIQGKHFNLKSVSESFRCVLVFTVK